MTDTASLVLVVTSLVCLLPTVAGLSCYVCDNEGWNWGTCTVKTQECAMFQDACTSYTAFHIPLEFHARGERVHHISKGCDTQLGCEIRQAALEAAVCTRTPYADWSCVECCKGDLCNYFITLGAGVTKVSLVTMMILLFTPFLYMWL